MLSDSKALRSGARRLDPRAPLGPLSHLEAALAGATDVDAVARSLISGVGGLSHVVRVAVGLIEGAGRRIRVAATEDLVAGELFWRHLDAYDDVPKTTVLRTGNPLFGSLDDVAPYLDPDYVAQRRSAGVQALAAWPLPGIGAPVGALVLFFDTPQDFGPAQLRLYDALAQEASAAIRRIRILPGRGPHDVPAGESVIVGTGERAGILLEGDPRAVAAARLFARDVLEAWDLGDEVIADAQVCLSELVTNAVIHAGTTSELSLLLDHGVLTVVVRDLGGSTAPALFADEEADPLPVFGRGLTLVDGIADRWATERDAAGTTAWFALDLERPLAGRAAG